MKDRKWCVYETKDHSYYSKLEDAFVGFDDNCIIDDFETAKRYSKELRMFGWDTEVLPYDIETEQTKIKGDLEEENRELKAKLETAEYWNRKYDGLLERVNDIKKAFRHLIKDHIEIINEINGFPLSAEKEEIDEYFDKYIQQAKESEKDD